MIKPVYIKKLLIIFTLLIASEYTIEYIVLGQSYSISAIGYPIKITYSSSGSTYFQNSYHYVMFAGEIVLNCLIILTLVFLQTYRKKILLSIFLLSLPIVLILIESLIPYNLFHKYVQNLSELMFTYEYYGMTMLYIALLWRITVYDKWKSVLFIVLLCTLPTNASFLFEYKPYASFLDKKRNIVSGKVIKYEIISHPTRLQDNHVFGLKCTIQQSEWIVGKNRELISIFTLAFPGEYIIKKYKLFGTIHLNQQKLITAGEEDFSTDISTLTKERVYIIDKKTLKESVYFGIKEFDSVQHDGYIYHYHEKKELPLIKKILENPEPENIETIARRVKGKEFYKRYVNDWGYVKSNIDSAYFPKEK